MSSTGAEGASVFGIGMSEMLIILAVALVVFGPAKLPEIAKSIAKGLREIRRAGDDLRASVNLDLDDERPRFRPPPPPAVGPAGADPADAAELAHIPGSELVDHLHAGGPGDGPHPPAEPVAPGASASAIGSPSDSSTGADERWPRPAEGTLAQGSLHEVEAPAAAAGEAPDDGTGGAMTAGDDAPKVG
jgi:TatA/E family protein of Tat protein translocase